MAEYPKYPEGKIRQVANDPGMWSALDGRRDMLLDVLAMLDETRARAEAAEAERDAQRSAGGVLPDGAVARAWQKAAERHAARAEAAEARLAAVEALCKDAKRWGRTLSPFEVRAAARGEGDRPAECPGCKQPNPVTAAHPEWCHIWSGKGDRPAEAFVSCPVPDDCCYRVPCTGHGEGLAAEGHEFEGRVGSNLCQVCAVAYWDHDGEPDLSYMDGQGNRG